jgi:L-methionine (R)-S-oxide reductase
LLVGPFQGKVACARIAFGRGVCGTSAAERRTIVVSDVHAFPGHIACDSASNAEIVIPVIKNNELFGVFDIDSPSLNRFTEEDRHGLETLLAVFVAATDFT